MIQNLLVSGCSFTQASNSWAQSIKGQLGIPNLYNVASSGAGNRYISTSIVDAIQHLNLIAEDSLVIVMWSGSSRVDELVTGEYWHLLRDYPCKKNLYGHDDAYWIHSGGRSNSWLNHQETVKLFQQKYLVSDPVTLGKETLANIVWLQNFLQKHRFRYKFMSYVNFWRHDIESGINGDYSLAYFCSDLPIYQAIKFDDWIFLNPQKDSLYEFCAANDFFAPDKFHPNSLGHQKFAEQVILPQLNLENL